MIGQTDRAQAFTLEGFVGSIVLLLAVLFAIQAVVITPTTGGLADRTTQAQLQQEASDALAVASQGGDLSETVLDWDPDGDGTFDGANQPSAPGQDEATYSPEEFNETVLGDILEERFTNDGWSYNVELVYDDGGTSNSTYLVYQGSAPSDAFTASQVVTLYSEDELANGDSIDDSNHPVPQAAPENNEIHNLVEVRVILW